MKPAQPAIKPEWLNIKDACVYAGVSRHTISRWIDSGMKVSRFGKRYLFKKDNIDAFIEGFENEGIDMDEIERKVMAGLKRQPKGRSLQ